jgi:DNA-binding transcriptional regulator LsrR (DeoR family)
MITKQELGTSGDLGAIGDTKGIFFSDHGRPVHHAIADRTIALAVGHLGTASVVVHVAGLSKVRAAAAFYG